MVMMGAAGSPEEQILARLGSAAGNNSQALLGMAAGLLGGQGFAGGFDRMAQGAQLDQSRNYLKKKAADEKTKKEEEAARKAALEAALGPDMVKRLGVDTATEYYKALELYKAKPKEPEDRFESHIDPKTGIEYQTNVRTGQRSILNKPESSKPSYDVRSVDMPDGTKRSVRVDRTTGDVQPLEIPGASAAPPTNPYATGKFNEGQGKAAAYADRVAQAEDVFEGGYDEKTGKRTGGVSGAGLSRFDQYSSRLPVIGNELVSKEWRKYDQAARNFINATLRRESGAVISESEFENARRQYLPQPGDDAETLKQKAENRRIVFEGMAREAGQAYRPPAGYAGPTAAQKAGDAAATGSGPKPPQVGQVVKGHRFLGGDPAEPSSWQKVQ